MVIPHAHAKPVSTLNDHEADIFQFDETGVLRNIGLQNGKVGVFIVHVNLVSINGAQAYRFAVVFKIANDCADGVGMYWWNQNVTAELPALD